MGLTQKGRSRIWFDDHAWWVVVVEFQPSGWSRGSYLNVGCMWLWHADEDISFDVGYRVQQFTKFRDEAQFEVRANLMVERAAEEVIRYRQLFGGIRDTCEYYLRGPLDRFWPRYHAAVACALAGRAEQSDHLFKQLIAEDDDHLDWVMRAQSDAIDLNAIVQDTKQFRDVMTERIMRSRELLQLPALVSVDFDT